MGKVYQFYVPLVALLMAFSTPLRCAAACDEDSEANMHGLVERINQRYDDFFRRQREIQEEQLRRERDAGEIKKVREEHYEELERARKAYVKTPKVTPEDPQLEQQWLASEKKRKEELKQAELCYAEKMRKLDAIERRGRRIPGNQEYDLDE